MQFANTRLPDVARVWDAMKGMRKQDEDHKEAIDRLVNKSADVFLYMLRRRAADALVRGEIEQSEAVPYMLAYLGRCGWRPSPEFAAALHDVFTGNAR